MGLFINKDKHPEVFKNTGQINDSNQGFFKRDPLSELLEEQQNANETLQHSFREMKDLMEKQEIKQSTQWKKFQNGLSEQKKVNLKHEKVEGQVLSWVKKLDEKNLAIQTTLNDEVIFKQEMKEYMDTINQSNLDVVKQLDKVELANEQLDLKVNKQLDLQKQLSQQITKQVDTQSEVLNRLDNQEALTEKILRQVDYLRSILFERTNYLAEKIDTSYNYTASYFTKLFSSTDKSPAHLKVNQKLKDTNAKDLN